MIGPNGGESIRRTPGSIPAMAARWQSDPDPPPAPLDDPFGDVLPDGMREEPAGAWGEPPDDDERLLREVPPHYG